jgi:hypothetical protein
MPNFIPEFYYGYNSNFQVELIVPENTILSSGALFLDPGDITPVNHL